MSYNQAAGLVWVIVSQQDCCELQSGCRIGLGYSPEASRIAVSYSQAARLLQGTVRPQDWLGLQFSCRIVLGYSSAAGFPWVMVRLQDCCELHSVANIQAAGVP